MPTVLSGVTLLWPRPQIEDGLTQAATESLQAAGLTGAAVTVSGRDATITGLTGPEGQQAIEIVRAVDGVRLVQLAVPGTDNGTPAGTGDGTDGADSAAGGGTGNGAEPTGAETPAAPEPFGIARRGDDIVLTGTVGSEEERTRLVEAATAQAGGRTVVDELTVTPGATLPDGVDAASVGAVTAAVAAATGDDLAATISADGAEITGTDAEGAAALKAALASALPGVTVDEQVAAAQVTAEPVPGEAGGGSTTELDAAAKAELQSSIDALIAGAPITFGPDSPALTADGSASVQRLIELVTAAPGARLQVDGFVATGPGNGRLTAQELSDQRAGAVRDALVAAGVPAESITARGRGEGDTPAERAAGRRVEITVL